MCGVIAENLRTFPILRQGSDSLTVQQSMTAISIFEKTLLLKITLMHF